MNRIFDKLLVAFILCTGAVFSVVGMPLDRLKTAGATEFEIGMAMAVSPGIPQSPVPEARLSPQLSSPNLKLFWQQLNIPNPPPGRIFSSLTLDSTTKRALLFGGFNSDAGDLYDLWSTDGYEWIQLTSAINPIGRTGASMAYDEARQETILSGGIHGYEYFGNTWRYIYAYDWSQQFPQVSPPPRAYACMAYDAARDETLLFGGINQTNWDYPPLNDTWTWDGTNWQQQFPSTLPDQRLDANMVYDRARQNIVLFGGAAGGSLLNDTWIWDGTTWIEQHPVHNPPGRADFGMAYDEGREQVILFGGQVLYGIYSDTWAWDGGDWTQLQTFGKPPVELSYGAQLVYLPDLQATALIGDFRQKLCNAECTFPEETQVWVLVDRYLTYLPVISR